MFRNFLLFQNEPGKAYTYHEVVQKPISPAYKEILEKTKNVSLRDKPVVIIDEEMGQVWKMHLYCWLIFFVNLFHTYITI